MNVWKYIYIKSFKIRRRVIGKCGADDYAAMQLCWQTRVMTCHFCKECC